MTVKEFLTPLLNMHPGKWGIDQDVKIVIAYCRYGNNLALLVKKLKLPREALKHWIKTIEKVIEKEGKSLHDLINSFHNGENDEVGYLPWLSYPKQPVV